MSILLGDWGSCSGSCFSDLDCDADVDNADLAVLFGAWGSCPEPEGEGAMMSGGGEGEPPATPSDVAATFGFDSVDEMAAWLGTLDFETMVAWLGTFLPG